MVKISECHIHEVGGWPLADLQRWLQTLPLKTFEEAIAKDLLNALQSKLSFLLRVGLDYLTLNREMRTLSGGEAQRIHLATQLGCQLVGTQYVLDEPTIGLHARDTEAMGMILQELAERETRSSWSNTIHRSSGRQISSLSWVLNPAIKADRSSAPPPIPLFSNTLGHSQHNICEGNEQYPYHPNADQETENLFSSRV